ncbi:sensor histidine kinase [Actinotalea ferrariae]|uniref:sensor histidine kinase n=1 Tax=Actinotalea ferrariae TaxID=1386098 RepID=UPI0009DEDB95|nr:HAMP domain-containing sensor histidine kinase [Actinotalea ferrariae]
MTAVTTAPTTEAERTAAGASATADAESSPGRSPLRRRAARLVTVRVRILAAVVALAALGMTVAGTAAFLLQRERLDQGIDASLERTTAEFRTLATQGVDPSTGAPFTSVERLLQIGIQRTVTAQNEGIFAVVDGAVELVPAFPTVRLETVPEVVAVAVEAQDAAAVRLRTVSTPDTSYRTVAIPVTVVGDPLTGVLVLGVDREAEHSELVRTYGTYTVVGAGSLVVLGIVGWLVAGRLLAPLRALGDTARRITDTDLSQRIAVSGDDDVSELARTVNSMLDRLEAAFGSQRRLLDDAGHELRTPVTIVRGHLELMDPDDPDDVRAAQKVAVDELDRMHLLVDDLVTLATVDRPDFVRPEPVDVGRLTDDVLDKARTLGDRVWRVDARAEVETLLDPRRVTQAWLQLAANAVRYSPPGSTVRLASRVRGLQVLLTVEDEGNGVAADDAERIFERFARAGAGRGDEGSGLGLPIVRAVAAGHDGRAYLDPSTVGTGSGSRFVIEIPLADARADEGEQ